MKYLLLIIRHLFPRKIWTETGTVKIWHPDDKERPIAFIVTQKDQFGNMRTFKVES